jgi:hypothetical protein
MGRGQGPTTSPVYSDSEKIAAAQRTDVEAKIASSCAAVGRTYPIAEAARTQANREQSRPDDWERAADSVGRVLKA